MEIVVLGGGCLRCNQLVENARKAADALGIGYRLTHEKDIEKILKYGILVLPALVVDGKVLLYGRVPSSDDLQEILRANRPCMVRFSGRAAAT